MKTLLLIVIFTGFLATGGYAQTIDCRQPHISGNCPGDDFRTTFVLAPAVDQTGCNTYKRAGTVITACPNVPDSSGSVTYTIDGTYAGNYPLSCTAHERPDGTVVVNCRPKCIVRNDPVTGRQWFDCPEREHW